MSDDICFLTATALLERYRGGTLSPLEVTQAVLARIDALNGKLNAFCLLDPEGALAAAKDSEARWHKGQPVGRLDGVPTTVKDVVLSAGWPTLRGSKTTSPDQPWEEDAPAVARLREHGAVLLGKTTTPEFGWKGVTDSPLTGITRNPWDLDHTPGGSSGGAGAAAVAGLGALHIGTDGGGSIRIPASFSGVIGLKASFGRVPTYPPSPFGTLSHLGPITRSAADAALMLSVMAQPDSRDAHALTYDARDYLAVLDGGVAGMRIAFSADLGYGQVDPEVAELVAAAAQTFAALGATVAPADPGFDNPLALFRVFWYAGATHLVKAIDPARRHLLDPGLAATAAEGEQIGIADYFDAMTARARFCARLRAFHERFELLLTPTMPLPAFPIGSDTPIGPDGKHWDDWSPFTFPFNLSGQPAASVPCGFTKSGLPVGLQIVGRNGDDVAVLRAVRAFEQAHPEHLKRPPIDPA